MHTRHVISVALLVLVAYAHARAGQTYVVAVVPQFTPVEIGIRWTPLLKHLESSLGMNFQLRVFDNIPAFEADLLRGGPDFAYLNPYHMVIASRVQGYTPLVRGAESLEGILVVDREGPVKQLTDLQGEKLAFPAPNAFGASLYMRALLTEKEKISFTPVYVGTHRNVYRHVLLREELAGGGVEATLDREPTTIRSRLRVLYKTPATPSHPLAAHQRVSRVVRDKVVHALMGLKEDQAGKKLLEDVGLGEVQVAEYTRDYLPLERLKLDRFLVVDKK